MGTQISSAGPGKGVPFVPPWVGPVDAAGEAGVLTPDEESGDDSPEPDSTEETERSSSQEAGKHEDVGQPQPTNALAPHGRFAGARTGFGKFGGSGSKGGLRSGLGNYVRSGLGGAALGARRMAGTANLAGSLFAGLDAFRTGENRPPELPLDKASLAGRPAREVGDRIIDAVCPVDGTQDAEAHRDSLSRSISELAEQFPNLDLTALTPEQIDLLLERFVSYDLCHRIELDIGKAIFAKAPDAAAAVKRIEEMRQYVGQKVAASFRTAAKQGQAMTRKTAAAVTSKIIRDTLSVFEGYLK
jgi:hypothetical protein